jgi:hypothetical protein
MKKAKILILLSLTIYCMPVMAAVYSYSWSGVIEKPSPYDTSDPFGFGGDGWTSDSVVDYSDGSIYQITILLDSLSVDTDTNDQRFRDGQTNEVYSIVEAQYSVLNATLDFGGNTWGVEAGTGTLNFMDNWRNGWFTADKIEFYGYFSLPQGGLHFFSANLLDVQTFSLAPLSINPVPSLGPGVYPHASRYLGYDYNGQYHNRTYGDLVLSVNPVPTPPTLWLFGAILFALVGFQRHSIIGKLD